MRLYYVPKFMSFLGFGIGAMFSNVHGCGIILLFSNMLYMLMRYTSPNCPMCLRYVVHVDEIYESKLSYVFEVCCTC